MDRCTCPGAIPHKDAQRSRRDASERRRALVKEAQATVKEQDLKDRKNISRAFEEAFRQRGLEFHPHELDLLCDGIEAERMPKPLREVQALGAVGRYLLRGVNDLRKILSEERGEEGTPSH